MGTWQQLIQWVPLPWSLLSLIQHKAKPFRGLFPLLPSLGYVSSFAAHNANKPNFVSLYRYFSYSLLCGFQLPSHLKGILRKGRRKLKNREKRDNKARPRRMAAGPYSTFHSKTSRKGSATIPEWTRSKVAAFTSPTGMSLGKPIHFSPWTSVPSFVNSGD